MKFDTPWFSDTDEAVLTEPEVATDELTASGFSLILYNDDVNTFDFVIKTLVEVCEHDVLQAEQCSIIVHTKGKCDVKNGAYEKLEPMCVEMLRRGLSAKIEK
ncbi:MAG: ATP-dependent Clp protease adaptor ClpS [Salibacteraceae bacterium]